MSNSKNNSSSGYSDDQLLPVGAAANNDNVVVTDAVQLKTEVPSGTSVDVSPAQTRATLGSKKNLISKSGIMAMFKMNLPWVDEEIYVRDMEPKLFILMQNYNRTHVDSFFDAWPGLLDIIMYPGEQLPATKTELDRNLRTYSTRLAEWTYQYRQWRLWITGALDNLIVLSRYNGNESWKKIASNCKWSWVNTYTNSYAKFPAVLGSEDNIMNNMRFAVGYTSTGSQFIAFPWYRMGIWGNDAQHCLPFGNLLSHHGGDGQHLELADLAEKDGIDAITADKLLDNLNDTIIEYGSDPAKIYGNSYHPRDPHLENGSVFVTKCTDGDSLDYKMSWKLNADSYWSEGRKRTEMPKVENKDQISVIAWNNYMYLQEYGVRNFSVMMDENSDPYVFFTTQVKLYEKSKTPKQHLDVIHRLKNIEATKLLESMRYKSKNQVDTATIVKWCPLVGGSKGRDCAFSNQQYITANLERIKTFGAPTAELINTNMKWPRLTPTSFAKMDDELLNDPDSSNYEKRNPDPDATIPYVINSIQTFGRQCYDTDWSNQVQPSELQIKHGFTGGLMGKWDYLLDTTSTRVFDTDVNTVKAVGLTKSGLQDWIDSADGIVFDEDPSNVRCVIQPLLEVNDPAQCGFSIIMEYQAPVTNEWTKYFLNQTMFPRSSELVPRDPSTATPLVPAVKDSNNNDHFANINDDYYFSELGFAVIFVGEGIFDHPVLQGLSKKAANPMEVWSWQCRTGNFGIAKRLSEVMKQPADANDPANGFEVHVTSVQYSGVVDAADRARQISFTYDEAFAKMAHLRRADDPDGTIDIEQDWIYFNPAYGPVKIASTTAVSDAGNLPVNLTDRVIHTNDGSNEAVNLRMVPDTIIIEADEGFTNFSGQIEWNRFTRAPENWLNGIAELRLRTFSFDNAAKEYQAVGDTAPRAVALMNNSHIYQMLLATTTAQYMGSNKSAPYWSKSIFKDAEAKCSNALIIETESIASNEEIVQARVARSIGPAQRDVTSGHNNKVRYENKYNEAFKGDQNRSDKKAGFNKSKRHFNKNSTKVDPNGIDDGLKAPVATDNIYSDDSKVTSAQLKTNEKIEKKTQKDLDPSLMLGN